MNAEIIWKFLKQRGLSDYGAAGLMGNLFAESALNPRNLQQSYEKKLGFTDTSYTEAVDAGTYKNFVNDSAGYGLAQWTYYSRKQELFNFAINSGRSIGDLDLQLSYLWYELTTVFPSVVQVLQRATSVLEASNKVLFEFEAPADQSIEMQQKRAAYGQVYYDKYAANLGVMTMTEFSSLVDHINISPNRTSPRRDEIDTVTIHCVVGQCTVESLGEHFANPQRRGSSNYGIGFDGRIGGYVPEGARAWTSGGKDKNGNEIFVNGISGSMNDHRAITIEVASDTFAPYAVTEAAYEALINLLVDICKRHPKIGRLRWMNDKTLVGEVNLQNMTAHRWFAPTECPGDYLFTRFGDIAEKVNAKLDTENIIEEDEDMTVDRFEELWHEMRQKLQDNDSSEYSEEARTWAVATGLIKGGNIMPDGTPNGMWEDLMTREQFVTVLYRFAQLMGKT